MTLHHAIIIIINNCTSGKVLLTAKYIVTFLFLPFKVIFKFPLHQTVTRGVLWPKKCAPQSSDP